MLGSPPYHNNRIALPKFISDLVFRQPPPGTTYNIMPADYEPTDQLYDQDMDYNIAPRKTKNGDRILRPIFKWIDGIYHQFVDRG